MSYSNLVSPILEVGSDIRLSPILEVGSDIRLSPILEVGSDIRLSPILEVGSDIRLSPISLITYRVPVKVFAHRYRENNELPMN
jgi:hypothetical protein